MSTSPLILITDLRTYLPACFRTDWWIEGSPLAPLVPTKLQPMRLCFVDLADWIKCVLDYLSDLSLINQSYVGYISYLVNQLALEMVHFCWSTTVHQTEIPKRLEAFPWYFLQAFIVPTGWIQKTLMIPWFLLYCHKELQIFRFLVKCLINNWMNRHKMWFRCSCVPNRGTADTLTACLVTSGGQRFHLSCGIS